MDVIDCLLLKDARLLTHVLPSNPIVDVTITSPPYWNLKDYGSPAQIGHGQTKSEYLDDIEKVLANCMRVTKSTGSLWLVVDTHREGGELQLLPFELAERARKVGWKLRDLIVWDRQHSLPWHSRGQLRNTSEFILFMSKSDSYKYYVDRVKTLDEISKWWVDFPERFNPKGKTPTNIWNMPMRPRGRWRKPSKLDHYCSFPSALVARIIELSTDPGDLVADPFAGSGVVLAQAAAMGRHYVGFEVREEYVRMFQETVKDEVVAEWTEMKQWREKLSDAKVDFEQTVMKLRALKYTRQVTKPFLEIVGPDQRARILGIVCMASIPDEYQRGRPFHVKIVGIVAGEPADFAMGVEAAKGRAVHPPLSQYGIRSTVQVASYSDFKRQAKLCRDEFYLYPHYRPRKFTASGPLKDWFEERRLVEAAEDGKIPMLANVAVDVAWVLET